MQKYKLNINKNREIVEKIVNEVLKDSTKSNKDIEKILRKNPLKEGDIASKGAVINALDKIDISKKNKQAFIEKFKMKKIRTASGVSPVTVLTKPFPCPGKCIFCPNDTRMPKSYLSDEPGAQRAESNYFDPYFQTFNRLAALKNTGHSISKVELIILGGTWSSYPKSYQIWFVKRCFDAMNNFYNTDQKLKKPINIKSPIKKTESISGENITKTYNQVISTALNRQQELKEKATFKDLFKVQKDNEKSRIKCIGLSIETRPDEITKEEVINIRKLGATKVQIGIQSLNDKVLQLNKRGHDSKQTAKALKLLRKAGFKLHAHYMPNLYGSTPKEDIKDFKKVFSKREFRVDEIKVYPCSLIQSAQLMKYYKNGSWKPYTKAELLYVLCEIYKLVPQYCRVTRMVRDIPSTDIVDGNKLTNFRQIVEKELKDNGVKLKDIRSREIRHRKVKKEDLKLKVIKYKTSVGDEYFLQYVTKNNNIAGFLRLSLPVTKSNFIKELESCSVIREVHVYGEAVDVGKIKIGKAQHLGLGKSLIKKAEKISKRHKFSKIAVISSIGTRQYYSKLGYNLIELYQVKELE